MQASIAAPRRRRPWLAALALCAIGATLLAGGTKLLLLGGSPYYLIAGATLLASAILLLRRPTAGYLLYLLFLGATLVWSVAEVGWDGWGLFARLFAPLVLGSLIALPIAWRVVGARGMAIAAAAMIVLTAGAVELSGRSSAAATAAERYAGPAPEWSTYAGDLGGTRFSPIDQITPSNVAALKVAWTYRTGDLPGPEDKQIAWTFEATPLQVGDRLFLCTAHSQIHAIDADTGRRVWMVDPHATREWSPLKACRGVAYFARPDATGGACSARVISPTIDGRLLALDAATGRPCREFGTGGEIDLRRDLGKVLPGYYFSTSAPIVVGGRVIVGAHVMDGAATDEPSGVVRAYDAVTGKLDWAWDMSGKAPRSPAVDGLYGRSTPNAWAPMSADPALGLVYVPLGNPTPDFFGAGRTAAMERFGSALVALDVATGRPRWAFQTTHHDLWDQDLPAQPSLVDLTIGGQRVPALVQPTKGGQLFVLDRRTGRPVRKITERPAPQGAAAGDAASPTQPFPTGMPSLLGAPLTEASTWGMTPIDQMLCRIRFRELRYDGPFTPPSVRGSLSYPGSAGIFSWGGATIDPARQMLIVNSVHSPFTTRLIPRAIADRMGLGSPPNSAGAAAATKGSAERASGAMAGLPQVGTPYAAQAFPFLSPLFVPCTAPPWGRLTGIDLKTGRIAWQHALGTSRDIGPLGMKVGLPLPIGVANAGGSLALRSGVGFIGAAQDRYLRAFDTANGRELWRARLPAGGQATPMTYYSPTTRRQHVVIAAGGHAGLGTAAGDYVVAYRLP